MSASSPLLTPLHLKNAALTIPHHSRFTSTTHPRAHLLIDSVSLRLLKGATIDYATELIGSQFVVKDNPQSKGAGCGCGVSWEPVEGAL